MKRYLIILITVTIITACVSSGKAVDSLTEMRTLDRVWLDSIRRMIDEDKIFVAYQELSFLEREETEDIFAEDIQELKSLVITRIVDEFGENVESDNYGEAYRYFCSLQGINREDLLPDWSAGRILFSQAKKMAEKGDKPLALLVSLRALSVGMSAETSPDSSIEEQSLFVLKMAAEMGNAGVAGQIIDKMMEMGFSIPEEYQGKSLAVPPVEKFVQGTVTIWVNKGIKIESGVGYPDRVIGSGFFIDKRGYLLTNYHVIASEVDPKYEGYSRLYIRLSERVEEKIPAKVVGYDKIFDLALIKAEVEPKFILSSAGEQNVRPGDSIMAIGSPAGLENTVTSGIVSATGRRFLQIGDAIQVDVPVNPGNSGGPLLNSQGQLVGVVFAGIEQFEGINFAIPFYWINKILPRLYKGGEVSHAWLGMALHESEEGFEVVYTVPGEPAHRAGLKQGDILETLNGKVYKKIRDIQAAVLDMDAPCLVTLTWKHKGVIREGTLTLMPRPFSPIETALEKDTRDNLLMPLFGMKIEKVGSFLWQTNYVIKQVLQGSIADETGLSENDPLSVQGWQVDKENRFAIIQIFVKKKKSGFLESTIQLAAYLEIDNFI